MCCTYTVGDIAGAARGAADPAGRDRGRADITKGMPVVVYEPTLDASEFFGSEVTHDLGAFKAGCDVIVANRWSDELVDVADKVYTRDLFKRD